MAIPFTKTVKNRRNGGMVELGKGIGFPVEVFDSARTLFDIGEAIKNLLDGTATVGQPLVVGNIHQAHPTTSQEALDTIASGEEGTWFKLTVLVAWHSSHP